jgi:hypothetical protein
LRFWSAALFRRFVSGFFSGLGFAEQCYLRAYAVPDSSMGAFNQFLAVVCWYVVGFAFIYLHTLLLGDRTTPGAVKRRRILIAGTIGFVSGILFSCGLLPDK